MDDAISILSSHFFSKQEAIIFQVGDDSLDGSFRYSDLGCDFAEDQIGLLGEQDDDVGVVCEEGPA